MKTKKDTLLISEIFPPKVGGSGRWFWEIYSRLSNDRYIVAAGADEQSGSFDKTHNLRCLRWPLTLPTWGITSLTGIKGYAKLLLHLRATIKMNSISAIHCGRCLPEGLLGWVAWKLKGIPYICYVHGEELSTYNCSREYKCLSGLVYSGARIVIANSINTKNTFISCNKNLVHQIRLMNPGVDTSYFHPKGPDYKFRKQFGWDERDVILTVGRLQKRKGHDNTILALKRIKESVPAILYSIAGDGEENEYLKDLVKKENLQHHVQFLGRVDDDILLSCYQQCDLFILANREVNGDFEGFGMVLIEAQACGKPVIAGKSGGTIETMIPEETGQIIDGEAPEIIANAVINLIINKDRRKIMGQKAALWVRDRFEWRSLVTLAETIFQEV